MVPGGRETSVSDRGQKSRPRVVIEAGFDEQRR